MADDLETLLARPGWRLAATAAVYEPAPGGWQAKVFTLSQPGRSLYARFHICVVDPAGVARYVYQATSVVEAARLAERHVPATA